MNHLDVIKVRQELFECAKGKTQAEIEDRLNKWYSKHVFESGHQIISTPQEVRYLGPKLNDVLNTKRRAIFMSMADDLLKHGGIGKDVHQIDSPFESRIETLRIHVLR